MAGYELFVPENSKTPVPLILILPILGRLFFLPDFWVEKKIARFFSKHGFASAVVQRDFFSFIAGKDISQIDDYFWQTVALARQTLDELQKDPRMDPSRIASLGISFGGIINVLLCAKEPRIKASVTALAGGNIPEILATSRDPLVQAYCKEALQKTKLSLPDFKTKMTQELSAEPLKWADQLKTETILLVIARFDRVVRLKYAEKLRAALKNPETLYLPLGHYFSLLALPYLERKALNFFNRKFSNNRINGERLK